ncbi:MAG: SIMPL domain-containing protein, partial [Gemmatimonadetes bacterium]|nr:SIMPL domain-containing protein [Gemmatimonadota bacterium]
MRVDRGVLGAIVIVGLLAGSTVSAAQHPASAVVPQVVTVGRGEVEIKPDRARLELGVETRASTAGAAAAENSRRQRAVLDAI